MINFKMPKILNIPIAATVPENASGIDLSIVPTLKTDDSKGSRTQIIIGENNTSHSPS